MFNKPSCTNIYWVIIAAVYLCVAAPAFAYPEFQIYVQENSPRNVNCSLCHSHPDGPEGLKAGQIGSLKPAQLEALNQARSAFDPGHEVESPILNEFGNRIIHEIGKTKFLELRQAPEQLGEVLDKEKDLDGDGIADVDEYYAGTHPLDPNHGDPATLFKNNLKQSWFHILMTIVATALGLYGLSNLLHGFDAVMSRRKVNAEDA